MSQASTTLESGALLPGPRGLHNGSPGKRLGKGMGKIKGTEAGTGGAGDRKGTSPSCCVCACVPDFVDSVAVLTYLKYQHSPPHRQGSVPHSWGRWPCKSTRCQA